MENKDFQYTYSAVEQREIEKIRQKYLPKSKKEDKITYLRRLDEGAERPGKLLSLTVGVLGILCIGMCCVLLLQKYFFPGIAIGVAGIIIMLSAYPVYKKITERRRREIAPEILRLTDELGKR